MACNDSLSLSLSVCLGLSLSLPSPLSLSLSLSLLCLSPSLLSLPFYFYSFPDTNDVQRVMVTLSQVLANVSCFLVSGSNARGCSVSISIGNDILIERNISHQVAKYLSKKARHFCYTCIIFGLTLLGRVIVVMATRSNLHLIQAFLLGQFLCLEGLEVMFLLNMYCTNYSVLHTESICCRT